ncbi:MAG TPA: cation:proton antiporter subunit C [Chthoniobacterales bacterium]|jgi:multicomponent Na+:H+ antiporter subunit C
MNFVPYAVAAWLFIVGLYAIVTSRDLIQIIVCLGVMQSSTYLIILSVGYRTGASAPIFVQSEAPPGTPAVDPVGHALVLTDIVVGATVMALLLALAIQVHKRRGTLDPHKLRPMHD